MQKKRKTKVEVKTMRLYKCIWKVFLVLLSLLIGKFYNDKRNEKERQLLLLKLLIIENQFK